MLPGRALEQARSSSILVEETFQLVNVVLSTTFYGVEPPPPLKTVGTWIQLNSKKLSESNPDCWYSILDPTESERTSTSTSEAIRSE